jgi:hypothetical protein
LRVIKKKKKMRSKEGGSHAHTFCQGMAMLGKRLVTGEEERERGGEGERERGREGGRAQDCERERRTPASSAREWPCRPPVMRERQGDTEGERERGVERERERERSPHEFCQGMALSSSYPIFKI